ncbi:MAG TPA: hypothetical protein VFN02_01105, partial [Ktedonobacteraceae bacterium]|nr:hypothetical protein [Ktedonobacteraceae bacterium]
MPAHTSGNALPEQQSESVYLKQQQAGVIGNKRLTALVSLVLLMLIIVELVTSAFLHIWLSAHTVVGVLLAGPLLLKMGATGWRFLRYYTRVPAYVRWGPPPLVLRVLGPVLLVTTLVMVGSGIGLVVAGPLQPLLLTHVFSALLWFPLIAVHSLARILQALRSIAADWSRRQGSRFPVGRVWRICTNLGALAFGVIGAWLLFPA